MPRHPPADVDPVFSAVAKAIYGDDVDPREVLAKSGGAGAPSGNPERDKKIAQLGLATTGFATVAGGHAVSATISEAKHRNAAARGETYTPKPPGPRTAKLRAVGTKAARKVGLNPKRAAYAAGAGFLGLHGVELAADGLGLHAQNKARNTASAQIAAKKKPVSKGLRLRPLNVIADRTPSLKARRPRLTAPVGSPRTKQGIYQPVGKGLRSITRNAERTTSEVADTATKVRRLVPTRGVAGAAAAGGLVALTGATYAGTRAGTYAGTRPARRKPVAKMLAPAGQLPQPVDEHDVTWTGTITKVDADQRLVFGWASVSKLNGEDVVDLQGDIVPIDEIEKSAYTYVRESRVGGDMHRRVSKLDDGTKAHHTADLVESMVFTPEKLEKMGLPADALPHGWWVGYKVHDDEQWALVKSGARAGFSIHGSGKRTPVSKAATPHKLTSEQHKDLRNNALRTAGYGVGAAAAGRMVNGHAVLRAERVVADKVPYTRAHHASLLGEAAVGRFARTGGKIAAVGGLGFAGYHHTKKGEARRGEKRLARLSKSAPGQAPAGIPVRRGKKKVTLKPLGPGKKVVGELHRYAPQIDTIARALSRGHGIPFVKSADGPKLRERVHQAVHPPAVKVKDVKSIAVQSMGYQPQTRRLSVVMRSRPGEPYDYKMGAGQAKDALEAPSKGRHFATQVRGRAKRAKHVTVADRARLFMDPEDHS